MQQSIAAHNFYILVGHDRALVYTDNSDNIYLYFTENQFF